MSTRATATATSNRARAHGGTPAEPSRPRRSLLRHLPAAGVLVALATFAAAAARYPGGTHLARDTVGFRLAENFVCSLFAPQALNGATNEARPLAIVALLIVCVSLGVTFFLISRSTASRAHRKTIEIAGIATAVYTGFVATPMHDLVVSIGLAFAVAAFLAITHLMRREGRALLMWFGIAVLALKAMSAVSYYGNVCYDWLPMLQKVGIAAGLLWLFGVYYRDARRSGGPPSTDSTL